MVMKVRIRAALTATLCAIALFLASPTPGRSATGSHGRVSFIPAYEADQVRTVGGTWSATHGELTQAATEGSGFAFLSRPVWRDAAITFRFRVHPRGAGVRAAGALLRSADSQSFYGVHFDTRNDQVVLYVSPWCPLPDWIVLGRKRMVLDDDRWYGARVEARGNVLRVWLEGEAILEAHDGRYGAGLVGLYTSQAAASFKEVEVEGTRGTLRRRWRDVTPPARHRIVCSGADAGSYAAFPDVCRVANGDLLCVFYSGYGHVSTPNDAWPNGGRVMACRSTDGGRSWTRPFVVADTPHDDRDPHIAALSDGTLICNWFLVWNPKARPEGEAHPIAMYACRSRDNGHTWSAPERIAVRSTCWYACSAPIRELPDGSLILGMYTEDPARGKAYGATAKSYDGGKTWRDLATIGEDSGLYLDAETDVIALKDGSLLAALRSSKTGLYFATSTDMGRSWAPVRESGFQGHCPIFLRTRRGVILLAHRIPNTALHWSTNEGRTWNGPVELDSVGGAYPGLVELPDGSVYCVYYEEGEGSSIRGVRLRVDRRGVRVLSARASRVARRAAAPRSDPARQPVHAYVSTGDNQWVSEWPPVDSPATVEALFDWMARTYGVRRVYWRGEQDRMWLRYYRFRRENPLYYDFWTNWAGYLTRQVRVDDLAVAAARRRGMQIYIFDGLFEHAAQGDAGGCGSFPYQCEDELRIEHPEWCPVDRWGERLCPGPIEFCYPEARKALVDRYVRHVTRYGYDGIAFYTYVENTGIRYKDEFGFNEPIVREFQRRYGVDIRTQPFDKEAWYRLRGEYVTQFLRELHAALAARGKKLSVTLRPDQPNVPQAWYGTGVDIPGTGMVHLDWETWAREGIVDELFTWVGGDPKPLLERILDVCQGRPLEVVAYSSSPFAAGWKPFVERGVTTCTVAAPGYGVDRLALEPLSPDSLRSRDWRLRAQALADIAAGTLKAEASAVAARVRDPHVLVRRQALMTLGALGSADHLSLLHAALGDRESSVRIAAANALARVHGSQTPSRLLEALEKDDRFQMREACLAALAAMKEQALPALASGLRHRKHTVREVCVRALGRNGVPGSLPLLLAALARDRDYRVRYWAACALGGRTDPEVIAALVAALADRDPAVQLAAARVLGEVAPALQAEGATRVFSALEGLFRQFGDGCRRPDAAWGWRVVGNALVAFGEPGRRTLEAMRSQKDDRWLAWAAYQVLYVPQSAHKAIVCTEQETLETHRRYAPPFPGWRR